MRIGGKRVLTWVAIYAVALHAILVGLAPPVLAGQSTPFDPLSVICHSAPATDQGQGQGQPLSRPGYACEHCKLCSITASPPPPDAALAAILAPVRVSHVLRPASATRPAELTASPKLARGPPLFV